MAEGNPKSWRDLCKAALQAKDPDELLEIVQELNKVLQREEQVVVISGRRVEQTSLLRRSDVSERRSECQRQVLSHTEPHLGG